MQMPQLEQVRLVSSGTEATMSAIHLARGFTGQRFTGEIRGLLPRPLRQPAGQSRFRPIDLWQSILCGRAASRVQRHAGITVQ